MIIFIILYGLFFVAVGLLVKRYPNLISGYNTMSQQKKANIDIKSTARLLCKYLIITGVVTITASLLLLLLNRTTLITYILIGPIFISLFIFSIHAQRYDHNKRSTIARYSSSIIIGLMTLLITPLIMRSTTPPSITIDESGVVISGSYGTSIPFEQIESIELLGSLPKIAMRVAGSAIGGELRGNFRFKDAQYGTCCIYISGSTKPYLYIKRAKEKDIILNNPDSLVVLRLYDSLRSKCKITPLTCD